MAIKVFPTRTKAQEAANAANRRLPQAVGGRYRYFVDKLSTGGWIVLQHPSVALRSR